MTLHQRLLGYVPTYVSADLAREPRPPQIPEAHAERGAVLICDIVGFTPYAEALAAQPEQGPERLSQAMQPLFANLIEAISAHGGHIVTFAGDALIAYWPALGELRDAVSAASACALRIREGRRVQRGPLGMRQVIGAGDTWSLTIGAARQGWRWLLLGAAVREASELLALGQAEEILLSAAAWAAVSGQAVGQVDGRGLALLEALGGHTPQPLEHPQLSADARALLVRYVPPRILDRIMSGGAEWLAELRTLSIVFVTMPELDERSADAAARIQAAWSAIDSVTERYSGALIQFLADDKGTTALIACGLGSHNDEDDAVSAVGIGLAVHEHVQALGVVVAIGIASGVAFCGDYGTDEHWEYTVVGSVVNRAARLMGYAYRAGLGVLCDEATQRQAQQRVVFARPRQAKLKGLSAAIAAYEPRQVIERPVRRALQLIGREEEQRWIDEAVAALESTGAGGVRIIVGEAGIGKSQLLIKAYQRAEAAGLAIIQAQADPLEQQTAYYPWRAVYEQLLGLEGHESSLRTALIDKHLQVQGLEPWAVLLNPILGTQYAESEQSAILAGAARAAQTRFLLAALTAAASAERPIVLLIEDAHWFDSASWALLRAIGTPAGLLICLTMRPQSDNPALKDVLSAPNAAQLELTPLGQSQTESLICQLFQVREIPPSVLAVILAKAEGRPLWSEEIALALRDQGLISIAQGVCTLMVAPETLARLRFPETIQHIIAGRINHLALAEQLVLRVASVLGQSFRQADIVALYPMAEQRGQIWAYLRSLEAQLLLVAQGTEGEHWQFRHALIQEAAYGSLLFAQRRRLHQLAGGLLEAQSQETSDSGMLAMHYIHGEEWAKALEHAQRAGDSAFGAFAFSEARLHYQRALTAQEQLPHDDTWRRRRIDLLINLVNVSLVAIDPQQNRAAMAEAQSIWEALSEHSPADEERLAAIAYARGRANYYETRLIAARADFEHMAAITAASATTASHSLAQSMIGRVHSLQGDFRSALALLTATLDTLHSQKNIGDWLWNLGYRAFCLAALGDYRSGVVLADEAQRAAQELRHSSGESVTAIFQTMVRWIGGDNQQAAAYALKTIALTERSGDRMPQHLAHGFRAWSLARIGEQEAAQQDWRAYQGLVQAMGGRLVYADWFGAAAAELALIEGDWTRARQQAAQASRFAHSEDGLFAEGIAARIEALCSYQQGDSHSGDRHGARSLRLLWRCRAIPELSRTELQCGQALLELGDHRGERLIERALRRLRTGGYPEPKQP